MDIDDIERLETVLDRICLALQRIAFALEYPSIEDDHQKTCPHCDSNLVDTTLKRCPACWQAFE